MDLLKSAQSAYILISLSSIPLILLALLPHLFPRRLSGIPFFARFSVPSISLALWTIIRCSLTVLDRYVLLKRPELVCTIDAILVAAFTTGMVAHIPAITIYRYRSLPTPSFPSTNPPTETQNAVCLIIIYAYSLLPCVPTLSKAISIGFNTSQGIAKWWGFYCIAEGQWFRIGRPIALLAPLALTLVFTVLIFSSLYSTSGHPSPHIHPSTRNWAQAIMLFLLPLGIGSYVVIEHIIGWNDTWWFRVFEALAGPILALTFLFDLHIWRTYSNWIRFKRPPLIENSTNEPLLSKSEMSLHTPNSYSTMKRSSSFYVDKSEPGGLKPKRSVRFPPTPQQFEYIPNRQTINSTRSYENGDRVESLLPPPAKMKPSLDLGLIKHAPQLNHERHLSSEEQLALERNLHPHPHSINEDLSPPTELLYGLDEIDPTIPQVYIQEPTPIHISRYSNSTDQSSQSSPFQYQDLVTMYSSNQTEFDLNLKTADRSTVFPYSNSLSTYTQNTPLPLERRNTNDNSAFNYMLKRNESTSTNSSNNTGLGEIISTIGKSPNLIGIKRSNTNSTLNSIPTQSDNSSIYSQQSLIGSYHGNKRSSTNRPKYPRRPSLAHSNFSSNLSYAYMPNKMAPTPEDEEVIYFESPQEEQIGEKDYDYSEEIEGSPTRKR